MDDQERLVVEVSFLVDASVFYFQNTNLKEIQFDVYINSK